MARFKCCTMAARVGGIDLYDLCLREKSCSRASFTHTALLDLSYKVTMNFSTISMSSSSTIGGYLLSFLKILIHHHCTHSMFAMLTF